MAKFKVGDKVRVKADIRCGERYHSDGDTNRNKCLVASGMEKLAGKIVTIADVRAEGDYTRYRILEDGWYWADGMFKGLAKDTHKIVITTDGKTTTARLYNGKELIKKAEAKCSTDDEFDFMIGAKLAMERLEEKKPAKPKKHFEVGDTVRIVRNESERIHHWFPVGSVGRVDAVDDDDTCFVRGVGPDGKHHTQWVCNDELEKLW